MIEVTSKKNKILVVEDNTETQLIIKVNLRDIYDVEITDNIDDAISLINNNNFDLVLLDINLGNSDDGRDVLNMIKKEPDYSNLPVIIITAYDIDDDEKELLMKLSCDYLEKPLDKKVLLNSIGSCLSSAK
ncbi:MAG: response regulator [Ignavibacteria bacterium]|nr:MAG: response regulator [Ignavibacteria bacterium]